MTRPPPDSPTRHPNPELGQLVTPDHAAKLRLQGWTLAPWYGWAAEQARKEPSAYRVIEAPRT